MGISPFSFRDLSQAGSIEGLPPSMLKPFLPQTSKKKEAALPPPPPPPTYSENDLKSAERDGYQRGFLDGVTEGKAMAHNAQEEINVALSALVETFALQIAPLFSTYREMIKQVGQQVPQLAQTIAKKVAGCALEEKAYAVIEDISLRAAQTLYHEPKLIFTVHESLSHTLSEKISEVSRKLQYAGEMLVVGDANIDVANCRIEWKNGAMVRDTDALWQQVEQVIAGMIATNEREAEALGEALEPIIMTPIASAPPPPSHIEGE